MQSFKAKIDWSAIIDWSSQGLKTILDNLKKNEEDHNKEYKDYLIAWIDRSDGTDRNPSDLNQDEDIE